MVRYVIAALCACGIASAQGLIEHAIITGSTAPAASGAKKGGDGAARVLERTGEALQTPAPARTATARRTRATTARAAASTQPLNRDVEDVLSGVNPSEVRTGMSRDELLTLAGKPWSRITIPGGDGGNQERLAYQLKSGGTLRVVITEGRVTEVKPPDGK